MLDKFSFRITESGVLELWGGCYFNGTNFLEQPNDAQRLGVSPVLPRQYPY